jgi:CHAD domain-containing protein/HD superfamily phosphodiesterase
MKPASKSIGLRYWMLRVLEECDNVAADFQADPVHDLRVALRRCRSMADGLMAMDPDRRWKQMKKAGKALFQSLGALRDTQIMMHWIDRLDLQPDMRRTLLPPEAQTSIGVPHPSRAFGERVVGILPSTDTHTPADPGAVLLQMLRSRESDQKHKARAALEQFDPKRWSQWANSLPARAARIRPGSPLFKHLALERWTTARALHTRALRNKSQVAWHTLRIGIKRLRYIVENFLPEEHKLWSDDLRHLQDLLGEVHDLDVLWASATASNIFPDDSSRRLWHARIQKEREERIEEYRRLTTGPESLWTVWRAGLPQGKQIQQIATRRMKVWAKALDPDFAHSERVARLSLELYDGLVAGGLLPSGNGARTESRDTLYVAALLHDVGKSKGNKGHQKASLDLIKKHGAPLGWKPEAICRAAVVARFHCGALPSRNHKLLRDLLPVEQKLVILLAAILRLANALDAAHDGRVRRLSVDSRATSTENGKQRTNGFRRKRAPLAKNGVVLISAAGYADGTPTAQTVAAERYLLETVLRRPVLVKPKH